MAPIFMVAGALAAGLVEVEEVAVLEFAVVVVTDAVVDDELEQPTRTRDDINRTTRKTQITFFIELPPMIYSKSFQRLKTFLFLNTDEKYLVQEYVLLVRYLVGLFSGNT
jgi:hypothetical protein